MIADGFTTFTPAGSPLNQSLPGARCQSFLSIDGELGVTSWLLATAAVSDSNGRVSLDPAPAGSVDVSCIMSSDRWSRPSAHVSLAPGAHSTVRLYSVAMATNSPGSVGLVFDGIDTSRRIAAVLSGCSAATAGFAVGDLVLAQGSQERPARVRAITSRSNGSDESSSAGQNKWNVDTKPKARACAFGLEPLGRDRSVASGVFDVSAYSQPASRQRRRFRAGHLRCT